MRARTSLLGVVVVGLFLPAAASAGQWPHDREGLVLGFNLGGGSAGVTESSVDSDRETGFAANGRIGWAFRPEVAAGLEGSAWTKEVDGETWTFSFGGAALTYYPSGGGFFVRGGIGAGSVEYTVDVGSFKVSASDDGFGFLLAAGYEWRLASKFALGPQVDYAYSKINDDLSINYINTTVGLNWYF